MRIRILELSKRSVGPSSVRLLAMLALLVLSAHGLSSCVKSGQAQRVSSTKPLCSDGSPGEDVVEITIAPEVSTQKVCVKKGGTVTFNVRCPGGSILLPYGGTAPSPFSDDVSDHSFNFSGIQGKEIKSAPTQLGPFALRVSCPDTSAGKFDGGLGGTNDGTLEVATGGEGDPQDGKR
ncbi:MAG: hypothetical protein JXB05_38970 [Myxococcaceae bacterium]|nr:hypothetical protein [Myxococcaceae bacterium]